MFTRFFKRKEVDQTKNLAIRQVLSVTKPRSFPTWKQWEQLPSVMTIGERKIFAGSFALIILSSLFLLGTYALKHRIEIPATGGTYTEAIVGSPRFINPLYAQTNDVDADISSLLYSGLIKWQPNEGYVNDLADSVEVNKENTQYTYHLRTNAKFSNGESVQASDVVFTYTAIQNPVYRSPLISYFRNVKVEQIDDQTVSFTLQTASTSFPQHLTVGILPGNLWSDILAQNAPLASLNLQPVGSGPYTFKEFSKDKKGSIRSYTLKRNSHYYGTSPKIDEIIFKFYPDEESVSSALINKNVEGVGYIAFAHRVSAENNHNVNTVFASIPRSTNLFFNTQNPILKNSAVRLAISNAIDKESIVKSILESHASVLNGPLMNGSVGYNAEYRANGFDPSSSMNALDTAGYLKLEGSAFRKIPSKPKPTPTKSSKSKKTVEEPEPVQELQDLSFTLTTVSGDEFDRVATEIKSELEKIGISITIKTVDADHLIPDVIDTQAFELLLVADYAGTDLDPYAFWHSSQIKSGGLNMSHYQNKEIDKLLEKAQTTQNKEDQAVIYRQFQDLLVKDMPAVFLYQSTYSYALPKKIHFTAPNSLRIPSDRFANITDWYIKTKKSLK